MDSHKALGSTGGPAEVGCLRVSWHEIFTSAGVSQEALILQNTKSIGQSDEMQGICSTGARKEHMLSKHKLLFFFLLSLLFSTTQEDPERAQEGSLASPLLALLSLILLLSGIEFSKCISQLKGFYSFHNYQPNLLLISKIGCVLAENKNFKVVTPFFNLLNIGLNAIE